MSDLYQEIIIEEYQHPHHHGQLPDADLEWHERNSSCGDQVTVYLKLDENKQKVIEMKWIGEGCAISQAATSLFAVEIQNKHIDQILKMSKHDLENLLGIEEIAYGREKCLLIGIEAVHKVLQAHVAKGQK